LKLEQHSDRDGDAPFFKCFKSFLAPR